MKLTADGLRHITLYSFLSLYIPFLASSHHFLEESRHNAFNKMRHFNFKVTSIKYDAWHRCITSLILYVMATKNTSAKDLSHNSFSNIPLSLRYISRIETFFKISHRDQFPGHWQEDRGDTK